MEKVCRTGVGRNPEWIYFVTADGHVARLKKGGERTAKPEIIARTGITREPGFNYFIDGDGDIARVADEKANVAGGMRRTQEQANPPLVHARPPFVWRPYQRSAAQKAVEALNRGERQVLIALPTGSGKTAVGLLAAATFVGHGGTVLWVAFQRELISSAIAEFQRLVAAGEIDSSTSFVFETIHTQMNKRIPSKTGVLVVDEAHHLHGDNESFKWARRVRPPILGLTGTPRRTHSKDGWALAAYHHRDALTPTYLATPVPIRVPTQFTPRHVKRTSTFYGSDFDAETYRALDETTRNRFVAKYLAEHSEKFGRCLVFVHNREHCETLAHACQRAGLRSAWVHGGLSPGDRDGVFSDFQRGAVQVLVNAKLVGEGIDVPDLDTVVLAVPTLSDIRFAQMVGRGCRKTDKKRSFYVVDFVDNLDRLYDKLLDGRYLFNGVTSAGDFDPDAVRFSDLYRRTSPEFLDQPYLQQLLSIVREGFLESVDPVGRALRPQHVEARLRAFAEENGLSMALSGERPHEVSLVHGVVFPLLSKIEIETAVRKEMACEGGRRCDVFIYGNPCEVIEFSTLRVGQEKARQLLGYLNDPMLRAEAGRARLVGTLVAVSFEGDSLSREITVDGVRLSFVNWHDYLRIIKDKIDEL
jgi:superfamily II DNA or RNA helicase